MPLMSRNQGQASVETVALLPLVVLVAALLWQALLVGEAAWLAGPGERGNRRRACIPTQRVRSGLTVRARERDVRVRVRVPALVGGGALVAVSARAHLQEQGR